MAAPMAIPTGVVTAKKAAMREVERVLNWAWEMQPPRAKPSKNWWNDRAAINGLMVHGLWDTPRDSPIITECDTIPSSKICFPKEKINQYLNKYLGVYFSNILSFYIAIHFNFIIIILLLLFSSCMLCLIALKLCFFFSKKYSTMNYI